TIDEASYEPDHPKVASALNNLASLLHATNRVEEAEPLMRRNVEIFLAFTARTGHEHPQLWTMLNNFGNLLLAGGRDDARARAEIDALLAKHGVELGWPGPL